MSKTVLIKSGVHANPRKRILISTPTLGVIRYEWAAVRFGQVIPCNWSSTTTATGIGNVVPMHYLVADAQNLSVQYALTNNFEWLLFWEDDVIPPIDTFLRLNEYMKKGTVPIVSGLYFTKGEYSEPILYMGRGTSCFCKFKMGEKVWVDGVPTGMLLIHTSILKVMWQESEEYTTLGHLKTRQVFDSPADVFYDPQTHDPRTAAGTSDLQFCTRVMKEKILVKAGWPKIAKKKHPFLCDTRIFCKHIDLNTGKQYPTQLPTPWIKQIKETQLKEIRASHKNPRRRRYAEQITIG